MQYRTFGKLDWKVSALGFGCMRFPTLDDDSSKIDEPEAARMVRHAIDQGVNYVDTAYPYHDGNSELVVGRILQDGYREKVRLATKMPVWLIQSYDDFDKYLGEQLEKLQTDHFDFYLLHALSKTGWPGVRDLGVLDWSEKAIADGRINYIGFSFHDQLPVFKEIIDAYDRWDFCQIQYNYMDLTEQAGEEGLKYAASKGIAMVIMEPLLGGNLVDPPDSIQEIWDRAENKRSAVDWALQWLWSLPEISVVLSGMSAMQQVEENLDSANRSKLGLLTEDELELVSEVRKKYEEIHPIGCTSCDYCMPCPNGLNIPRNFEIFNRGIMIDSLGQARFRYSQLPEGERASECAQCLDCEELCPQQLPVSAWMEVVHDVLGLKKDYNPEMNP